MKRLLMSCNTAGEDPNTELEPCRNSWVGNRCLLGDGWLWLSPAPYGCDLERRCSGVGKVGHQTQGEAVRSGAGELLQSQKLQT